MSSGFLRPNAIFFRDYELNVVNIPPKRSRRLRNRRLLIRRPGYKKAVVTLAPGDTIDVFEGVQ